MFKHSNHPEFGCICVSGVFPKTSVPADHDRIFGPWTDKVHWSRLTDPDNLYIVLSEKVRMIQWDTARIDYYIGCFITNIYEKVLYNLSVWY